MEKQYKYIDGYLSQDLLYQKVRQLQDAAFGADCLTPLRILNYNRGSKKWTLVMLSKIVTCCKTFQIRNFMVTSLMV